MGRARGASAAATAADLRISGFDKVFGTRRGGPDMPLFELWDKPSAEAIRAAKPYSEALQRAEFASTLAFLTEHAAELDRWPRLVELRDEMAMEAHQQVAREYGSKRLEFFTRMGLDPYPPTEELRAAEKFIRKAAAEAVAAEGGSDEESFMEAVRECFRRAATYQFAADAIADPERVLGACLGQTYTRLRAEAAGVVAEQDLQDLAKDPDLAGTITMQGEPYPPIGHLIDRKNWREFASAAFSEWRGEGYRPAPGVRSTSRYKLARLVRKRYRG